MSTAIGYNPLITFQDRARTMTHPTVLELGTMRSIASRPTHHKDWVPFARRYVMSDFEPGLDVDVITDAHQLGFADSSFDLVIACSVYEHLQRPWIVTDELRRVTRLGGLAFVSTHQTFPLHAYPYDYWRFSTEALKTLFADGWDVNAVGYTLPTKIIPDPVPEVWDASAPAWLLVALTATRVR